MKKIHIEYINDLVCSWCPINYLNMKSAIEKTNFDTEWSITFLPFEINPNMPPEGVECAQHLMGHYGWTAEQHSEYRKNLLKTASEAGLNIDFSKRTHYYNTSLAHRLVDYAELEGKHIALYELLMKSYFCHGLKISDVDVLLKLAVEVGLSPDGARAVLESEDPGASFIEKQIKAKKLIESGVPVTIINGIKIQYTHSAKWYEKLFYDLARENTVC
jgi:predicted DsbA family dithiol-disulfide isomerase